MYIYIYNHIYIYVYVCMYVCIYIKLYIQIPTFIYITTYTHTHRSCQRLRRNVSGFWRKPYPHCASEDWKDALKDALSAACLHTHGGSGYRAKDDSIADVDHTRRQR